VRWPQALRGAVLAGGASTPLVYYSLTLPQAEPRPDLLWQLEVSLASLRARNRSVAVALFAHGALSRKLAGIAARHDAMVHLQPPYEARLARLCPKGWPVLSCYPLLHKFLNFAEISAWGPSQVLFLDCDTVVAGDVGELFARYRDADCYAREEVNCRRSRDGYDRGYLDEEALAAIGRHEGVQVPPPFNLGVVLFNNGCWRRLAELESVLVSYAWRFAVWLALHPASGRSAAYGEGLGIDLLRRRFAEIVEPSDRSRALPYPSANRWLLDELALWLTMGHLVPLRTGDFSPRDVAQDGEFLADDSSAPDWVLCHYFSQNTRRMDAWIRSRSTAQPASRR
jgi:hypothetical protein